MLEKSTISAIRFGYGLRPGEAPPSDARALLAQLERADAYAGDGGIADWKERAAAGQAYRASNADRRAGKDGAEAARTAATRAIGRITARDMRALIARPVASRSGFRERLVSFWTDHFTVAANGRLLALMLPDMIEVAIRPGVTGKFSQLLRAVALHPAMLVYLNQVQSVGPNSMAGQRRGRGLNENLAREVLELHTLGVGGAYTQEDVRALAELLTGLSLDKGQFRFRPAISEPGAKTVLGRRYGGARNGIAEIEQVLDDLATHPDTAHHIARKLVQHFVGGIAADDLVGTIATRFLETGGDLTETYAALLSDDRAWDPEFRKAKLPFEFVVSSLRAAGFSQRDVMALSRQDFQGGLIQPMTAMGQPLMRPGGPDGWDEAPENWITPAGLAARIRWASVLADRALGDIDPRAFMRLALRDASSPFLEFAVAGSESRSEGNALVLASPEFNRR